jgi:hypothetical protein
MGKLLTSIGDYGPRLSGCPGGFPSRLAAVKEVHTPTGTHKLLTTPFPQWVPQEVQRVAQKLTEKEAASQLAVLL